MLATKFKTKYFFDLDKSHNDNVILVKALEKEASDDQYLPRHGLFSRAHSLLLQDAVSQTEVQRFAIDGAWESEDFSRFHGKIADVYATINIAQNVSINSKLTPADRSFIRSSIQERSWSGGGSYLAFYGVAKSEARLKNPLRVKGISYNSPGHIDLVGEMSIIEETVAVLSKYVMNFARVNALYKDVYSLMRKQKLLSASWRADFESKSAELIVARCTREIAILIGMPNPEAIIVECANNEALFAKIMLSFCRRLNDVAKFTAEGRLKLPF